MPVTDDQRHVRTTPARSLLALLAALFALVVLPAAAPAATPPAGFAGLGNWSVPTSQQATQMGQIGLRTWRAGLVWNWVEPTPGNRNWGYVDQLVREGAKNGYDVLLVLNGCAQWACGATRTAPAQEPALGQYRQFVATDAQRYARGGAVWAANPTLAYRPVSYQVWNEVNAGEDWPNPSAAAYAPFLATISATIRAADPGATIVTSGLVEHPANATGGTLAKFLGELYAQPGFRESFDVLAVHGYSESPAGVVRILDTARRLTSQAGDGGRRIWLTELGWSSGGPAHPFTSDEGTQAAFLQQSYDQLVACRSRWNLERAYWFSLNDINPAALGEADYWGMHTGLWRADGSPKGAWGAFAEFTGEKPLPGGRGDVCGLPGGTSLDTSAIDTVITSAPRIINGKANPVATFTASRGDARFECSLDSSPWTPCRSPYNVKTTREGAHELVVRAIDGGGVADPTPARVSWMLDLTPPDTRMTKKPPRKPKSAKVRMRFRGVDATGIDSYQCRQFGQKWKTCKSGQLQKLSGRGFKRLQVRAIDKAGNVDPQPASAAVTVNLSCLRKAAKKVKGKKGKSKTVSCKTSKKPKKGKKQTKARRR